MELKYNHAVLFLHLPVALNRTLVELKSVKGVTNSAGQRTLNRTLVELKYDGNSLQDLVIGPLNRTLVELKCLPYLYGVGLDNLLIVP